MEPDKRVPELITRADPSSRAGRGLVVGLQEHDFDEPADPLEPPAPTVALIQKPRPLGGLDGLSRRIDRVLARSRGLSRVPDGPEGRERRDEAHDELRPLHGRRIGEWPDTPREWRTMCRWNRTESRGGHALFAG